MKRYFLFLLTLFILFSCSKNVEILHFSGMTMGTTYNVKYVAHPNASKEFVRTMIDDILKSVNGTMSAWDKESELSKINVSRHKEWIKISSPLFKVIETSVSVSKMTDGAFDITVGPAVNLWGFGPTGERKIPVASKIHQVLKNIGYKNIALDTKEEKIKKLNTELYIDLSAIAKGYGVDRVGLGLEAMGITDYIVEIGGEVRTRGTKGGNGPWLVGIESPKDGRGNYSKVINLSGMSVATSGNYRNFFKSGGKLFSHTIDPLTAMPVKHKLISASVIHKNCMTADALATSLMVLGPEMGKSFIESNSIAAFLIYEEDGKVKTYSSKSFYKYVEEI